MSGDSSCGGGQIRVRGHLAFVEINIATVNVFCIRVGSDRDGRNAALRFGQFFVAGDFIGFVFEVAQTTVFVLVIIMIVIAHRCRSTKLAGVSVANMN